MSRNWLEQDKIICPDCGGELGTRSVTGAIQIVTRLGMDNPRCVHPRGPNAKGIQCPRVKEAVAVAKLTHARQDQQSAPK